MEEEIPVECQNYSFTNRVMIVSKNDQIKLSKQIHF
jgi:hypothetical protein